MKKNRRLAKDPGQQPALQAGGRRPPDRRQISSRWLAGIILTGFTSCTLMGGALFVALDGRELLATPPELLNGNDLLSKNIDESDGNKGGRVIPTLPRRNFDDRRTFELSIMQKTGNEEVIRTQPFELVRMALAEDRPDNLKYPAFNALTLFANNPDKQVEDLENNVQIYGAKVESEITLRSVDFVVDTTVLNDKDAISEKDAEEDILAAGFVFSNNKDRIAALNYIDPMQFGKFNAQSDVRITQENVTIAAKVAEKNIDNAYAEDMIPVRKKQEILDALKEANYAGDDAKELAKILTSLTGSANLSAGDVLRVGMQTNNKGEDHLVRASVYHGVQHDVSVALNDDNVFIQSTAPEMTDVLQSVFEDGVPLTRINASNLPKIYDAVYRAVLSYEMPINTAKQITRVLANDFDLQSRISPNDTLEVFYAVSDKDNDDTIPEINFISANFGGVPRNYYRFRSSDGTVDYYDSQGRSSKQFLLRNPVPTGIFRSPFGARKHPILGYVRMHKGVDWSAPRGTPIIASGDGIVTKAGFSRSYGNHTEIRHANGYVTTYSHQNGFAKGIYEGAAVRQGQVIGYVGSTGLSTGPHCHYEVEVNGTKVDPMRIRLPDNKALSGKELQAFQRDRNRIDSLINGQNEQKLAAVVPSGDQDS